MNPQQYKRLNALISGVESLSRIEARGQLDTDGRTLLAQLETEMETFSGPDLVLGMRAWRRAGSPTRDPRPARVEEIDDEFRRDAAGRPAGARL